MPKAPRIPYTRASRETARDAPWPLVAMRAVPRRASTTASTSRRVGSRRSFTRYISNRMAGMVYWSTVAVAALL